MAQANHSADKFGDCGELAPSSNTAVFDGEQPLKTTIDVDRHPRRNHPTDTLAVRAQLCRVFVSRANDTYVVMALEPGKTAAGRAAARKARCQAVIDDALSKL